jgi:hypothetical protein
MWTLWAQAEQVLNPQPLGLEFGQRHRDDAAQQVVLAGLVLFPAVLRRLLIASLHVEHVVGLVEPPLPPGEFLRRHPARLDGVDQVVETAQPALERPQQREGRAGQPPLEDAHRQPGGGAVEDAGPVVVGLDVVGRLVVEGLLADRTLGQLRGPGFVQRGLFEPPEEQAQAVAKVKRAVNEALGRFTVRSGATLPLADVYRDEAQSYDVCDVRGKICF